MKAAFLEYNQFAPATVTLVAMLVCVVELILLYQILRKLHQLVLKVFFGPFVVTFFVTLFFLLMQFLWKYIDELVGKGLEPLIIAELLFYASANLITMALPLAILLSSIMTFGNLGEHYELVALKSSGLSLQRIMAPLVVLVMLLSTGAFLFSNYLWPVANLKFATLLYDVRQKKPAIDIQPGIFYKGLDGYVIRVGDKDKDNQGLYDIRIYDHTSDKGNTKVIKANSGKMQMTDDERYLVITLNDGSSYEEMRQEQGGRKNEPMFRTEFDEEIIRFDLSGFQMQRSDDELFKDNYAMLNLYQLEKAIDTLYQKMDKRHAEYQRQLNNKMLFYRDSVPVPPEVPDSLLGHAFLDQFQKPEQNKIIEGAINLTRSNKTYVTAMRKEFESRMKSINRHKIEWHRKFTLSIACLVLFFIGAPLGAIIRKGGLGMPFIVSVLLFLVFHITSMVSEKLAKSGEIEPWRGMWMATMILTPIGIYLTWKATTDSPVLDRDTYVRMFNKLATPVVRLLSRYTK